MFPQFGRPTQNGRVRRLSLFLGITVLAKRLGRGPTGYCVLAVASEPLSLWESVYTLCRL